MGLVEADAGDVGGFDGIGVVVLLFREGDGKVLNPLSDPESHQNFDEVSDVFDEVVIVLINSGRAPQDYVIGYIEH